jgi:tetratricopeptide (TPR) repeat protein
MTKRKVLIILLIALIPAFLIGKRLIAIELQRQAISLNSPFSNETDIEAALNKIDLALKLAPRNYLFYGTKAEFLVRQNKLREANAILRQIFEFKEDYAEGYFFIAMNYERMNLIDSAQIEYQNALDTYYKRIKINKPDKEMLLMERINIGCILRKLGKEKEAQLEFKNLKEEYPEEVQYIELMESQELDFHDEEELEINWRNK